MPTKELMVLKLRSCCDERVKGNWMLLLERMDGRIPFLSLVVWEAWKKQLV
jgi:hypothetical protein